MSLSAGPSECPDSDSPILFPIFVRQGRSLTKYKAGYMNRLGEVVVEPIYDAAYPFSDGLASVRVGEKWGAIDNKGNLVIEPFSGKSLEFLEGRAEFSPVGGTLPQRRVIDRNGTVIVPPIYKWVSWYSGGLAMVHHGDH
jgi:hypothetical protein